MKANGRAAMTTLAALYHPIEADRLPDGGVDCFATALALAEVLGPEFSSEDPHALAGRGDGWFNPA